MDDLVFLTLFDRRYAARGMTMVRSLSRFGYRISVLSLDDWAEKEIPRRDLPGVSVVPLGEVEDGDLRRVRGSRFWREYCWTLSSAFSSYMMERGSFDAVVYLDADLYFFADPEAVLREIGPASVAAVPHRLDRTRGAWAVNGRYNVGFVYFRGDDQGRECLARWRHQCLEWCSGTPDPGGRLGDQKYLDEWPTRYWRFHEIGNPGAGLAPWNVADRTVSPGPSVDGFPVVFFNFHEFEEDGLRRFRTTRYPLSPGEIEHLYIPYVIDYVETAEMFALRSKKHLEEKVIVFFERGLRPDGKWSSINVRPDGTFFRGVRI